jgi:hypothetical protein
MYRYGNYICLRYNPVDSLHHTDAVRCVLVDVYNYPIVPYYTIIALQTLLPIFNNLRSNNIQHLFISQSSVALKCVCRCPVVPFVCVVFSVMYPVKYPVNLHVSTLYMFPWCIPWRCTCLRSMCVFPWCTRDVSHPVSYPVMCPVSILWSILWCTLWVSHPVSCPVTSHPVSSCVSHPVSSRVSPPLSHPVGSGVGLSYQECRLL